MMRLQRWLGVAVLCVGGSALAQGEWQTHSRKQIEVSASTGTAKVDYSLSIPEGWVAELGGETERIGPDGEAMTGFMILAVHRDDAGAERLLNESGGLAKWVTKVHPWLRLVRTERARKGHRDLLNLTGTQNGKPLTYLVSLARAGEVNLVLIGYTTADQKAQREPLLRKMHQSFIATAPPGR